MNSVQAARDRALYEKVKASAPTGVIPMMATLREQVVLANNNGTYKFSFNEQKAGARPTEILLSIKDAFFANGISLGLLIESKAKPGSGVVVYYPDAGLVSAGGAAVDDLEAVYNGMLKAQIDRDVLLDKLSTRRFRRVPQRPAQQGSVSNVGSARPVAYYPIAPEQQASDGIVLIEPNLVLKGTKQNEFTLTLPQFGVTPNMASPDPQFDISVVLELHGFLLPGGAGLANQ